MNRLSQSFKIGLAFLFAVLSTNLLPVYASALTAPTTATDTVDICHANEGKKGYTSNSVNVSSIDNLTDGNGHGTDRGTHGGDIIPPFTNTVGETYTGKNWTTATQAIYKNDCKTVEDEPVITVIPLPSGIKDICGRANDTLPSVSTDTYTVESDSGWVKDGDDATKTIRTISYKAKEGTKFEENTAWVLSADRTVATYTFTDWGSACEEPKVELVKCDSFPVIQATNKDLNGWTLSDNASFVHGGIKLDVTGNWDTTTITRSLTGELRDLGTGVDFTPNEDYLGLHVKTSKGTLTYEKYYENQDPANAGKWWSESDFGVNGGQGYSTFDTLENIVAANPDVTLENLRVLYTNPNPASVVVTSVKIGCNEYTFDYVRMEQACTVRDNTYRDSWQYDGSTFPEATDYDGTVNNATYKFTPEGLHISTPDTDSYVFGLIDGGKTALSDIDTMSYMTYRKAMSAGYPQTHPAYVLYVDINGNVAGGETYFVYEPYNNSPNAALEDTWQTWDTIDNGDAQWWMSGTGQKLQSWSYFVKEYPEAVVLAYGFNQGTSNAETYSIVQDVTFDCATTHFDSPQVLGDSTSTTTTTTTTPVTSVVTPAPAVLPAQIPATGSQNGQQSSLLAAIILGSLTYFVVLRRKQEFEL